VKRCCVGGLGCPYCSNMTKGEDKKKLRRIARSVLKRELYKEYKDAA